MKNLFFKSLCLSVFFLSFYAHGAAVKLDMRLDLGDSKTSHPQVLTKFGEEATITQTNETKEGFEMSVIASRLRKMSLSGEESVKLSFVISRKVGDVTTVISQPEIITKFGQKATISETNSEGKKIELTVVPTLQ